MILWGEGMDNTLENKVKGFSFREKLLFIVENGVLDYWETRKRPPNLSIDEFFQVMRRIDQILKPKWIERKSTKGSHGERGEDFCFKFICQIRFGGIFQIEEKSYFVKGYFFDKGNLKGVTIQSFRED